MNIINFFYLLHRVKFSFCSLIKHNYFFFLLLPISLIVLLAKFSKSLSALLDFILPLRTLFNKHQKNRVLTLFFLCTPRDSKPYWTNLTLNSGSIITFCYTIY